MSFLNLFDALKYILLYVNDTFFDLIRLQKWSISGNSLFLCQDQLPTIG